MISDREIRGKDVGLFGAYCGLKVIEDFIRDHCDSKFAYVSKVFLLDRLDMYSDVLNCVSHCRMNFTWRSLPMDLKEIDALTELGKIEEAYCKVDMVSSNFGEDKVKMSLARLHVIAGKFDDAIECVNELKSNGSFNNRQDKRFLRWIRYCKREAGKEVGEKVLLCDSIQREHPSASKPEPASSTVLYPVQFENVDSSCEPALASSSGKALQNPRLLTGCGLVPAIVQNNAQELVDDTQLSDQGAGLCDEVLKEKEHVCPRSQSYALDESDQLLLKFAQENHDDKYFATAFGLLTIIKERNKGDNEAVDQLYLECDQKKGKCGKINFSNS